ncbi:MAG: lipopolysaccharide kinase InaA family protein [bacterium]
MQDYVAPGWQEAFASNELEDFDAWWQLDAGWFEPPNQRRGGWSGVSRLVIRDPRNNEIGVFLKRQENHGRKTLQHPWSGEQTFVSEFRNMQAIAAAGVSTLEPLYFATRSEGGNRQAILVTRELSGFLSLESWLLQVADRTSPADPVTRQQVARNIAKLARTLHRHRWVHNCFYDKHLFVNPDNGEVRVIDLEKMRRVIRVDSARNRDLDTLNRHIRQISNSDRLRFLLAYLGKQSLDAEVRGLWEHLQQRLVATRARKARSL